MHQSAQAVIIVSEEHPTWRVAGHRPHLAAMRPGLRQSLVIMAGWCRDSPGLAFRGRASTSGCDGCTQRTGPQGVTVGGDGSVPVTSCTRVARSMGMSSATARWSSASKHLVVGGWSPASPRPGSRPRPGPAGVRRCPPGATTRPSSAASGCGVLLTGSLCAPPATGGSDRHHAVSGTLPARWHHGDGREARERHGTGSGVVGASHLRAWVARHEFGKVFAYLTEGPARILTQRQLARLLDCSQSQIHEIIHGRQVWAYPVLERYSVRLSIPRVSKAR